jgi:hypothetical protein
VVLHLLFLLMCFVMKSLMYTAYIYYFQVQGQLSLVTGAVLTFGLILYPYSEFELMAEELLMSDSTIKVILLLLVLVIYSIMIFIYLSCNSCG